MISRGAVLKMSQLFLDLEAIIKHTLFLKGLNAVQLTIINETLAASYFWPSQNVWSLTAN